MNHRRIRRRLAALDLVLADREAECTLFKASELEQIELRIRAGEVLATSELKRLERQSPIILGELLMTCHAGQVFVKRYVGVDLVTEI